MLRGGALMSIGNLPEVLSQRSLVGIIYISREIGRTEFVFAPWYEIGSETRDLKKSARV